MNLTHATSGQPLVSVIVVNFNGRDWLERCLGSLERQTLPRHWYEIWLIDNGSRDDSVALARARFPGVQVVEARRNLGFAAGNNAGFVRARGSWLALLNTDAIADPQFLQEALRAGSAAPDIGGVACQLRFHSRPEACNSTGLELYRDGRAGDRDLGKPLVKLERSSGPVFGPCGAAALYRRAMLDATGGFDPSLFMYYEDMELAWRARRAGWRFVYCPRATARHACGASAGVASPLQVRCIERNRVRVSVMHAPILSAVSCGLGLGARSVRAAWRWSRGSNTRAQVLAHLQAVTDVLTRLPGDALSRWRRWPTHDTILRKWARPGPHQ